MASTQQQPQQKNHNPQERRLFRGGLTTYRVWCVGLSIYALVVAFTATNVAHPKQDGSSSHWMDSDQSSRGRFLQDFLTGFSSLSSASLKKQTILMAGSTVSPNGKITMHVSQIPQVAVMGVSEEKSAAAAKSRLLTSLALSQTGGNTSSLAPFVNNFTFPTHGCLATRAGERVHCHFQNLRIVKSKISAGQMGGEPLESVMGQDESSEYLSYQNGAFTLPSTSTLDPPYPSGSHRRYYYMNDVIQAIEYENTTITTSPRCDQVVAGLTLFITRYEYVNFYHAMTEWWNAFFSLPRDNTTMISSDHSSGSTSKVKDEVNVVFLDAHPEGNLDPVWAQLFGNVTFVRHLPFENTCFEEARFIPTGYGSPLYPGQPRISAQRARDFVEHVLNAYNLSHVRRIPGHVVVIDRVRYIAHARSQPSRTKRTLGNLQELALNLPSVFPNHNVTVEVVTLVNDTMRDQIAAIRRADVLVANHGAGLTHLLLLDTNAHVVELSCTRGFFQELAKWRRDIHHYCQPAPAGFNMTKIYWFQHVVSVVRQAVVGNAGLETM